MKRSLWKSHLALGPLCKLNKALSGPPPRSDIGPPPAVQKIKLAPWLFKCNLPGTMYSQCNLTGLWLSRCNQPSPADFQYNK